MAWTTPRAYVVGQVMTVALMNEISDNLKLLKGMAGTVPLDAGLTASGLITATEGMVGGLSGFVAGTPVSGTSDITVSGMVTAGAGLVPAAISGQGNLTTSGLLAAGAGVASISHISALGNLTVSGIVNARRGLTAPTHISCAGNIDTNGRTVDGINMDFHAYIWLSGAHGLMGTGSAGFYTSMTAANCGSYVGNGPTYSGEQYVAHSLGIKPKIALIQSTASGYHTAIIVGWYNGMTTMRAGEFVFHASPQGTSSSLIVGTPLSSSYTQTDAMNRSGVTYLWFAAG